MTRVLAGCMVAVSIGFSQASAAPGTWPANRGPNYHTSAMRSICKTEASAKRFAQRKTTAN